MRRSVIHPPRPSSNHTSRRAALRNTLLAISLFAGGCGDNAGDRPATVAQNFYAALEETGVSGAPTTAQLEQLRPYLSDTLRSLLAGADRLRQEDIERYPDDKPSFAEGDLFSSLFEGPTSFRVGPGESGSPYRLRMDFTHASSGSTTNWSDYIFLVRQGDRWVVDDVEYGGDWDFAAQGSLRTSLELVLGN